LTIIYFWLYHFEDAGCRTSGVCYVLFLLVFMSLGVTYVIFLHRRNSVSFKFWINSVYRPCGPVQILLLPCLPPPLYGLRN